MLEFAFFLPIPAEAAQDRVPVRVVPGALLRVGENFIGGRDFREEGGCRFDIAVVAVGVEFKGFAAIGFFYSRKEVLERVGRGKERGKYSSSVAKRSTPRTS